MDNITHTLTGVLLARAGINKLTPRATWVMVLALNAPDIDVLWSWGRDSSIYLDHHRGFTHSFFFMPLIGLLPVILTGQFHWKPFPWKTWLAAMIGVCVHIAQDTTNVYGIRSLWPLTDHWYRLDWVSVVDPWIWALLLVGVGWPALSSLVTGEIGAKRDSGAIWARAVLTMLLVYVLGRGVLHGRAVDLITARSYAGRPARTASAFPSLLNPLSWTGVAETANDWRILDVDLTGELFPDKALIYPKIPPVKATTTTAPFRAFLNFSQFPVWSTDPDPNDPNAQDVEVCDLRFGMPGEGRFCAIATVDASGKVEHPHFQMGPPGSVPEPK